MRNRPPIRTLAIAGVTALALGLTAGASASAKGFIEDELEYGYFYGTFDQTPNVALFAGGPLEEFCITDPGTAPLRVFPRADGTVDLKVNDKEQPIYLYHNDTNDIRLGSTGPPRWRSLTRARSASPTATRHGGTLKSPTRQRSASPTPLPTSHASSCGRSSVTVIGKSCSLSLARLACTPSRPAPSRSWQ